MAKIESDIVVKESTLAKFIGIVVVFFAAIGFLFWLYQKIVGGEKVNFPDAEFVNGDGSIDANWVQNSMPSFVSDLHKTLNKSYSLLGSYWTSSDDRCEALKRVVGLNNNQIRAVHNSYKETFKQTIRRDLQDVNTDGCGAFQREYGDLLMTKLNELNLP